VKGAVPPVSVPNAPQTSTQPTSTEQYRAHDGIRPAEGAAAIAIVLGKAAADPPASDT